MQGTELFQPIDELLKPHGLILSDPSPRDNEAQAAGVLLRRVNFDGLFVSLISLSIIICIEINSINDTRRWLEHGFEAFCTAYFFVYNVPYQVNCCRFKGAHHDPAHI
jgi:hypothetical protein